MRNNSKSNQGDNLDVLAMVAIQFFLQYNSFSLWPVVNLLLLGPHKLIIRRRNFSVSILSGLTIRQILWMIYLDWMLGANLWSCILYGWTEDDICYLLPYWYCKSLVKRGMNMIESWVRGRSSQHMGKFQENIHKPILPASTAWGQDTSIYGSHLRDYNSWWICY